jgi:hypothetical protein
MLRCQYVSLLWVQHLRELRLTDVLTHGEVADIISKYGNNWFASLLNGRQAANFYRYAGARQRCHSTVHCPPLQAPGL